MGLHCKSATCVLAVKTVSGGLRAEEEAGQSRCRGWADTEFGRRSPQKSLHFPERGGKFPGKRREKGRGRRRKNRIGEWREGRKAGIREGRPAKKGGRRVWQGAKRSGGRSGEGCGRRKKFGREGTMSREKWEQRQSNRRKRTDEGCGKVQKGRAGGRKKDAADEKNSGGRCGGREGRRRGRREGRRLHLTDKTEPFPEVYGNGIRSLYI